MSKMSDVARKVLGGGGVTGGLEKIKTDELIKTYPEGVAVNGFDLITFNGGQFPVFTFIENPAQCFSGGKALQELVEAWLELCDGDIGEANAQLAAEPVVLKLSKVKTKTGRDFTKVQTVCTREIETKPEPEPETAMEFDDETGEILDKAPF